MSESSSTIKMFGTIAVSGLSEKCAPAHKGQQAMAREIASHRPMVTRIDSDSWPQWRNRQENNGLGFAHRLGGGGIGDWQSISRSRHLPITDFRYRLPPLQHRHPIIPVHLRDEA